MELTGELTRAKLQTMKDQLEHVEDKEIFIKVNSRVGDIEPALELAQYLSQLKTSEDLKITVYIDGEALGPSAIFPFIATRWMGTPIFEWGDMIYGSSEQIQASELQTRVLSLISEHSFQPDLLRMIAQAMIDPEVTLVNQEGWKLIPNHGNTAPLILTSSDVLNMNFEVESLMPEQFQRNFGGALSETEKHPSLLKNTEEKLAAKIHYKQKENNLVGLLDVGPDHPIDQTTYLQIKFALEDYKKRNVIFVLLHLNTPGGELFSAMKIAELLQQFDAQTHIPVVSVIHNWALSAGAMLAYATRFIVVAESGLMGAAQPVITGAEVKTAPEKIVSALRAEFASLAKFYGRNPWIAEAMVDPDLILVKRNGQIIPLKSNDEIITQGTHPDQIITTEGKLLTLDSHQLIDLGVADIIFPLTAMRNITAEQQELGEWPAVQDQLFSDPFFASIPNAQIIFYHNWKVNFFSFLTHPIVSSLLMMGLIIGFYLEMTHPGFGVPGITALVCLSLLLLSHFAIETIDWLEILFIVVGILLVLAEIFVFPSFGFLVGAGILLAFVGLIAMLLPRFESLQFSWDWHQWNLSTFEFMHLLTFYLGALLLALVLIALLARFATPRLLKKSRIILDSQQEGHVPEIESTPLPPIGAEGEAFTSLRPGGKIQMNFHLYDAMTEGDFIDRGEKVIVSKIRGNVIIVAKRL